MITMDDMVGLVLEACPSFTPTCQAFLDEWRDEPDGPCLYIALYDLADHLIGLLERGETAELPAVFRVVERWLLEGDDEVREAATVGLLEDLQNLNLHSSTCPEQFRALLGPESVRCWDELAAEWQEFFRWQESQQRRHDEQRATGDRPCD